MFKNNPKKLWDYHDTSVLGVWFTQDRCPPNTPKNKIKLYWFFTLGQPAIAMN
jgi:hypothetical protein